MAEFEIVPLGNGRYRVSDGTSQRLAYYAAGAGTVRWVFIDGRTFVIDVSETTDTRGKPHHDDMALASPMPATVSSIHVSAGQAVSQGDLLVVLEAMKMELPIKAPRDGRVRAVMCTQGELVQPGVPLVELD